MSTIDTTSSTFEAVQTTEDHDDDLDREEESSTETTRLSWTNEDGYTYLPVEDDGERYLLGLHQLNALASGASLDEVFSEDTEVHHRIPTPNALGVKIDVPSAVEPVDKSEHTRLNHEIDADDVDGLLIEMFDDPNWMEE